MISELAHTVTGAIGPDWWVGALENLLLPLVITIVCTVVWGKLGVFTSFVTLVALSYALYLPLIFHSTREDFWPGVAMFLGVSSIQAVIWLIIWAPAAWLGLSVRARRASAPVSN